MRHVSQNATPDQIATKTGVTASTVRKWYENVDPTKQSRPTGDAVVAFAREYGRPCYEALIAAEYMRPDDIEEGVVIELRGTPDELSRDELLDEIRRRIRDSGPRSANGEVDDIVGDTIEDIGDPVGDTVRNGLKKRGKRA